MCVMIIGIFLIIKQQFSNQFYCLPVLDKRPRAAVHAPSQAHGVMVFYQIALKT
jgi:hypothetical protein